MIMIMIQVECSSIDKIELRHHYCHIGLCNDLFHPPSFFNFKLSYKKLVGDFRICKIDQCLHIISPKLLLNKSYVSKIDIRCNVTIKCFFLGIFTVLLGVWVGAYFRMCDVFACILTYILIKLRPD